MSFLAKLLDKGEAPMPVVDDPHLGRMTWSKDDEGWIGTYAGVQFALGYERKTAPTPVLLAYAKEVLGDVGWLFRTLEDEKKSWAPRVPPSVKDELAGLRFGLVYFSLHKEQGYIFATVDGGGDDRSWRIEYHGRECDGLGFDT